MRISDRSAGVCSSDLSLSTAPPKAEAPARASAVQQARDMGANVPGPVGERRGKTRIVIAIERAQRLLIARAVAADMAHEMIGRVAALLRIGFDLALCFVRKSVV